MLFLSQAWVSRVTGTESRSSMQAQVLECREYIYSVVSPGISLGIVFLSEAVATVHCISRPADTEARPDCARPCRAVRCLLVLHAGAENVRGSLMRDGEVSVIGCLVNADLRLPF